MRKGVDTLLRDARLLAWVFATICGDIPEYRSIAETAKSDVDQLELENRKSC